MSACSQEAASRYTLRGYHRQKPQPSPHTAPNGKRAGRLGEGRGLGVTQQRREMVEEGGGGLDGDAYTWER